MAIRLSGMISGLDTDALVKELISSYSTRKDNMVKAKTKHEWKMDAWKDMNKSIYGFYTKSLSNMRLSGTYNAKKTTVSQEGIAKVSGSATAVNGTQTLEVRKLASAGYLTGAKISGADGVKLKGSSKVTDIAGMESLAGSKISIEGKDIEITEDMTISNLVSKMKSAGVGASFDENNQRFFVNAKASGAEADFTINAADVNGIDALKALGLFTVNATDKAEYEKYANMTADEITALKAETAAKSYYTVESYTEKLTKANEGYQKNIDELNEANEKHAKKIEELEAKKANGTLTEEDVEKIQTQIDEYNAKIAENNASVTEKQQLIDENSALMADETALSAKVTELNAETDQRVSDSIDAKIEAAKQALTEAATTDTSGTGAVRIIGSDSEIWLNGAKYVNTTNTYSINGLTIQAQAETEKGKSVTITTDTDVDAVYDTIKNFFSEYNKLVNSMDSSYNAASSGDYEPLTSEEKEAMTEEDIEKWEKKIKDALLRRDSTLNGVASAMKNVMLKSYDVNGTKMSLASFGIKTLGYFGAADNEKNAYHIDGNADDESVSANADKLKEAIANDPESVVNFFQKLSTELYDTLTSKMKGTSLSSAYTVYNDKQMKNEYDAYEDKIKDLEDYLKKQEDYWYDKFSAMEAAMSKLQSQQSSLASMLGM